MNRLRTIASSAAVIIASAGVAWATTQVGGEAPPEQPAQVQSSVSSQVTNPVLMNVPWDPKALAMDPIPTIDQFSSLPALEFPAGTSHQAALTQLWTAYREQGDLPRAAKLVGALPSGKIFAPGSAGQGVRISLVAPFGWLPETRTAMPPTWHYPLGTRMEDTLTAGRDALAAGKALPEGAVLDLPPLPECQIVDASDPDAAARC